MLVAPLASEAQSVAQARRDDAAREDRSMERRGVTPYQRLRRLWVRIRPLGRNSALRPGASRARFYGFTRRAKQELSLAQEEA